MRSSGTGHEFDLAKLDPVAASRAAQVSADGSAAAGVSCEAWRPAGSRVVPISPLQEHDQGGRELASFGRQHVLRSPGPPGIGHALEHRFAAEQLEAVGECVGRDAEAALEVLEALDASKGVAKDQQRPALPDNLQGAGD